MGDGPPYLAVINLALMTAFHWRTVRLQLVKAGVENPMEFSTAHILLDMVEELIMESIQPEGTKQADYDEAKQKREDFTKALYQPKVKKLSELPDGWKPPPAGFDDDDENDAAANIAMTMVAGR